MNNASGFQPLNPAALAAGCAVGALAVYVIFGLPLQLTMGGMMGGRMTYGMPFSVAPWLILGSIAWVCAVSAIGGAIVGLIYNAVGARTSMSRSR